MSIPIVSTMRPALGPTLRATPWTPLLGATTGLLVIGTAIHASGGPPSKILAVGAAVMAAAVLAGLHDPAADLLEPLPVSAGWRRAHRMLLLVPVGAAAWVSLLALGHLSTSDWPAGQLYGPLVALVSVGLAAATWARPERQVTAAVAAPLLWFALYEVTGGLSPEGSGVLGDIGNLVDAWRERPWGVTVLALTAVALGWRR
jgi:hypothetical protein